MIESKLIAIMGEAHALGKESKNTSQGFSFRGIDAVMNHLHPLFAKHGVVILPEVIHEHSEERTTKNGGTLIYRILKVRFNFVAADGSSRSAQVVGEGMDSGDKAANKAMAVALKYALTQMLLLPYDEVDPDGDTPPESKPTPKDDGDGKEGKVTGIVKIVRKSETSRGGTRFGIKLDSDDRWFGTFDAMVGEDAERLKDEKATLTVVKKGQYWNCVDIIDVPDTSKSSDGDDDNLPF